MASRDCRGTYWNTLAKAGGCCFDFPLWRRYCDQLHCRFLQRGLPALRLRSVLKTDLFDEACGGGLLDCLQALMLPGGECHGLDISSVVVERAVRRHPSLRTYCCDVRSLPFASSSFDLVLSNSTLDHFDASDDLLTALQELHRVLTPGGLLAITLDNPRHPLVALRNRVGRPWMGTGPLLPYFVGHTLSLRQLSQALRELGFEVLTSGYLMHAPRLAAIHLSRLLPVHGAAARWFLGMMLALERLAALPTAPFTGHFVGIVARKLPSPSAAAC